MNILQQKQEDFESQQDPGQVMVFADVECLLDSTNTFVPILICYARDDDDIIFHHWGTNCIQTFLPAMMDWSNQDNKEEDTKGLHIFFHNLQGFDGSFMIDALYKMNLKVTDIMATGTKALHFKHRNLKFKRLPLLNEYAADQFHKDLWIDGVEKRLVSSQVFKAGEFRVRRNNSRPPLLRYQRYEGREERRM